MLVVAREFMAMGDAPGDASERATRLMELDCISFSNVDLHQSVISGKNAAAHMQRIVDHCADLLNKGILAVFVCEVGDNMIGAGQDFQEKFEDCLTRACNGSPLQLHWKGELLCAARSSVKLTASYISANCRAKTQQWRYVQVVDIHYKAMPVKIYHLHLTSSAKHPLTDNTRQEVFASIARHAHGCPMKHGFIIGGDTNSSVPFLTELFTRNTVLFASPIIVFPETVEKRRPICVAICWDLNIVPQKCYMKADVSHDVTLVAWPRMEQSVLPPEGCCLQGCYRYWLQLTRMRRAR